MRHSPTKLLRVCLVLLVVAAQLALAASAPAASIAERVQAAVSRSGLGGQTSVTVYDVEDQAVLIRLGEDRPVAPASNEKLVVTAAALQAFGPNHRFETTIAVRGTQRGSVFTGDVFLIGGGDPSLSTRTFQKRYLGGAGGRFDLLPKALEQRGISKVVGNVVVDDDRFDERRWVGAWKPSFRYDESPALGALTVNRNYFEKVRGDGSRLPDIHAGQFFVQLAANRGIRVTGKVLAGSTPDDAERIGLVQSPPLRVLLRGMNKYSDNFVAEILLKNVATVDGKVGTTDRGARIAKRELGELGLQTAQLRIVDGSGLASSNRMTTGAMMNLLNIMDQHETFSYFWLASLAVSGQGGTLEDRLDRFPYKSRVRAKTGTINETSALSGYATRLDGQRYGFSIVTYNPGGRVSWTRARDLQDRIAAILVR